LMRNCDELNNQINTELFLENAIFVFC